MAINTINATIQMRRGLEQDFNADKMVAGEWAVSTDKKYVRMCFAPGLVYRMATYESFEEDMAEIRQILTECNDIQTAVNVMAELAEQHRDNASASATAAAASESAAAESMAAAEGSAAAASTSEESAANSAATATQKAADAEASAGSASASATAAAASESAAAESMAAAEGSAAEAENSANLATEKSAEASGYADTAKSYAIGTDGVVRPGDPEDNAKFYSQLAQTLVDQSQALLDQAQRIVAAATEGGVTPAGTVAFADLPTSPNRGYMYNISDDFTTDDRFSEGAGIRYKAGANIYWTRDGKWDVMVGVQVTGVKGAAESTYRVGDVNITPANIGLGDVGNFKAVSTVSGQGLSDAEKSSARENIGAGVPFNGGTVQNDVKFEGNIRIQKGTNNYGSVINIGDGDYIRISEDEDDILTVKAKEIRLNSTNTSNANAVIANGGKVVTTKSSQGLTDAEKANARANIGAGTSNFSGIYNDLSNKPNIPSGKNDLVTASTGYWLDAYQGKVLNDKITLKDGYYTPNTSYQQDFSIKTIGNKAILNVQTGWIQWNPNVHYVIGWLSYTPIIFESREAFFTDGNARFGVCSLVQVLDTKVLTSPGNGWDVNRCGHLFLSLIFYF